MPEGCPKTDSEVSSELVSTVRSSLGPVAAFRLSAAVPGLPRTRSGKTARKTIADMAKGKKIKVGGGAISLQAKREDLPVPLNKRVKLYRRESDA